MGSVTLFSAFQFLMLHLAHTVVMSCNLMLYVENTDIEMQKPAPWGTANVLLI